MRLVTFSAGDEVPPQAGVLRDDDGVVPVDPVLDAAGVDVDLAPADVIDVLERWDDVVPLLEEHADEVEAASLRNVRLHAPVPWPLSLRDFYAFEEHVARAWERRGEPVPDAWYEIPVFYFENPMTVIGPGDPVLVPAGSRGLDFELEVAWVLKDPLLNPTPEEAADAIAGLTIMDDWSARDLQRREMTVGLGPSKGKDFATSLGPSLVGVDELQDAATDGAFDLEMTARVNGETLSEGNLKDLHWSLGEMTAHAARDVPVRPGEVLATGTVGTGSLLDLGRELGDYLEPGDEVTLEVERLGSLTNTTLDPDDLDL